MNEEETQHLAWSFGKAFKTLSALAANNGEFRERLRWSIEELSTIPRGGLPERICAQLVAIDNIALAGYVPGPAPHNFTIVSQNIRKIRGQNRVNLATDIISVCMDICELYGEYKKGARA